MSQTKAQLVAPIGVVTASGVVVSGVMTAVTFDGDIVGSATSIIQGTNLNVGAFNATSFAGDFTGNATGIITSSDIKVGQLTASSFVGDFTGTATSMFKGTGFEAGAVTGSAFVADVTGNVTGNATGLAGSVAQGTNIHVGVITATSFYGDGSNLTGIAATNFNTQTVTADGAATTIDLSAGNVITFNQSANTTVSFANTSEAMNITLIRIKDSGGTARTITWPDSVNWNGGSAPTLISHTQSGDSQQFQFLTRDSGLTWYAWEPYKRDELLLSLWGWGGNHIGQLGLNNVTAPINSGVSSPTQVGTNATWSALPRFGGWTNYQGFATKNDGTLWSWGSNTYGAMSGNLGLNDIVDRSSPTQVGTDTDWPTDGSNMCKGRTMTAIKTDGTLWSWGYDLQGNNGQNSKLPYGNGYSSPVQIPGTWSRTCSLRSPKAIRTDGTIWTWGSAHYGILGLNENSPNASKSSPMQIGTDSTWSDVVGNFNTALASKTDGTLWSWGYNGYAMLGQNNKTQYSSPTQVGTDTTWGANLKMAANRYVVGAIKTDGTMWVWGGYTGSELGQGTDERRSSPVQVGTETTWDKLSCYDGNGAGGFTAIKTDGSLWIWGTWQRGALGMMPDAARNSPTQLGTATNWHAVGADYLSNYALLADP